MKMGDKTIILRIGKWEFYCIEKSTLLLVSLTIQRQSKVNISDNNLNF
jgi:hypothetical protein